MKKLFFALFALALCFASCACAGKNKEESFVDPTIEGWRAELAEACTGVPGSVQDRLLNSYSSDSEYTTSDLMFIGAYVPVAGRTALYEQQGRSGNEGLRQFMGEPYEPGGEGWYRVKDMDNLKYLIREEEGGELFRYEFRNFESLNNYSYGEVYSTIFGVNSADDILCITTTPGQANNTLEGKEIQNEVGVHTYQEREDIEKFYEITAAAPCRSGTDGKMRDRNLDRYTYSFSDPSASDKLASGESTWGTRSLIIVLQDGTTIDTWIYCALNGMFYEYGGVMTEPLAEEEVRSLNAIFGIE